MFASSSGYIADAADRVAGALPVHVRVSRASDGADAALAVVVEEPRREHQITQQVRSVEVRVGSVAKPNPDYPVAEQEVTRAEERLDEARADAEKLRRQADESARQIASSGNGVWGAIGAGAVAGIGAGGGAAVVSDAESDVREAKAELARTPRTIDEVVTRTAQYPVVSIHTTATVHVVATLEGFGDVIEEAADARAEASAEQIVGSPEIGVNGTEPDLTTQQTLSPDLAPTLAELGRRLAVRVAAIEREGAWGSFVAMRADNNIEAAAEVAAAYLDMTVDSDEHRDEVITYLVENLP
jgi:hypothetical protein